LGLCGTNGNKFPGIKAHIGRAIGNVYKGERIVMTHRMLLLLPLVLILSSQHICEGLDLTLETFPPEGVVEPKAYLQAIEAYKPGDAVTVFTPGEGNHWQTNVLYMMLNGWYAMLFLI